MIDNLLVSVIIPTFNEENHIIKCLNSVFDQSYPSNLTEVFVIDGGSTDKTIEYVRIFQEKQNNLFILNNNKRIQAAAFNIGIKRANGDVIIRMDAHCFYDSNYIHYCVLNHSLGSYGNVGGRCVILPSSNTLVGKSIALINTSPFGLGGANFRTGNKKKYAKTVPFGSYPKKVLSLVDSMNEDLPRGEDNEFNARILKAGFKILFDPRIIAYYFPRNNLRSFLQQMFSNGFSIGILLRNYLTSVGIHHIIPMLFIIFLGVGSILSISIKSIRIIFLCILSFYFLLAISFGFHYSEKNQFKIIPVFLYSIFLVHIVYGIGTIIGLFKGCYKQK